MSRETKQQRKARQEKVKPLRQWQKALYIVYTLVWTVFPFIVMNHPQWSQTFDYLNTSKPYLLMHLFPVLTVLLIHLWPHKAGKREPVFGFLFFVLGVLGYWYNPFTVIVAIVTAALSGIEITEMMARIISEILMIIFLFFAIYLLFIGNAWRNEIIERKEKVDSLS